MLDNADVIEQKEMAHKYKYQNKDNSIECNSVLMCAL